MALCFGLALIDKMLFFLHRSLLGFLQYLGADFHFQNISKGILDSRDIVYFLSVSFIALYGTYLIIEERR
jgi:ABC-2 type transport system permease protein